MPSTIDIHAPFKTRVQQAVSNPHLADTLTRATLHLKEQKRLSLEELEAQRLRDQMRQMKAYSLRNLPSLLEQFQSNVEMNGGTVHWAEDADQANRVVTELAERHGVRKVVKSKSMATEEIHLNHHLEARGITCVETDLGEYIIQLAEEIPSHIVAPVIHKRVDEISDLFADKFSMPRTLDPQELCARARTQLREEFLTADMGVSGCNFAIAKTGTVCIVTNEGNGRMVSSLPPIYVVVMGIEKLVPTPQDAFLQYQSLTRSATGQRVTVYMSMTSGPKRAQDVDGPEEFHIILLDNGRSEMLADGYGESLMCIRCGACLNVCPVYRQISGHGYGNTYSGPIGAVITPLLSEEMALNKELPYASTLCGACRDACPVQIDLPKMLLNLRRDLVSDNQMPALERKAMQGFAGIASHPSTYAKTAKLARTGTRLLTGFRDKELRRLPPPLHHWTRHRDFPPLARQSFREWWAKRPETKSESR